MKATVLLINIHYAYICEFTYMQVYLQLHWFEGGVYIFSGNKTKWVHCHHGMAHCHVGDGGDRLQTWRMAKNILNNQSGIADKGRSYNIGAGQGADNFFFLGTTAWYRP
jgi:hypothetical protein